MAGFLSFVSRFLNCRHGLNHRWILVSELPERFTRGETIHSHAMPPTKPSILSSWINQRRTASFAVSVGTEQALLDLVEVGVLHLGKLHQPILSLIAREAATPTGDFNSGRCIQIGQLQVGFPVHQKSSARGMRV